MFTQQDNLLTPAWGIDAMPMSQFGSSSWDATDSWGTDEVDVNTFFSLPPSIDEPSQIDEPAVEPHQSIADFYWSLAAAGNKQPAAVQVSALPPYGAPLSPPDLQQPVSPQSAYSTPSLDMDTRSPASSSSTTTASSPNTAASPRPRKKMLRTSTRRSEPKPVVPSKPAQMTKEAKLQRAKNCHNLVEKKYRNRLNNHFELLLAAVVELKKQGGETGTCERHSESTEEDDDCDVESLSSKGHGSDDTGSGKQERTMSKSDVLRLARETLLDLDRRNKELTEQVGRLKRWRAAGF